jgi:hypothetical protein
MDAPSISSPPDVRVSTPRGRTPETSAQIILDLLGQMGSWEPFCGPSGAHLWRVPGSDGKSYVLSDRSCTCPSDEYRRDTPCKHRQTLALYRQFVLIYFQHIRTFRCLCAARYPKE